MGSRCLVGSVRAHACILQQAQHEDLGRFNAGVIQQGSNIAQVGTLLQKMGCERMAQRMRNGWFGYASFHFRCLLPGRMYEFSIAIRRHRSSSRGVSRPARSAARGPSAGAGTRPATAVRPGAPRRSSRSCANG